MCAIGDFVDLKCPFTLGHSRAVATLSAAAGESLGMLPGEVPTLRRAGHLHDLGRLGVSNQVWSKPADLSPPEWERVRMHPYLTERVLDRIPGLGAVRTFARAHHEHLDGSGFPLGIAGSTLGRSERVLAAAVAYQSALEPRPYRDAMTPQQAMARLRSRCSSGDSIPTASKRSLSAPGTRQPGFGATTCSPLENNRPSASSLAGSPIWGSPAGCS